MIIGKKADFDVIGILIILVLTTFALLAIITTMNNRFTELAGPVTCKASISQHASAKTSFYDFVKGVHCGVQDITIPYSLVRPERQEEAKQTIAQAMYTCYNQFGGGEIELFEGSGTYCAICSYINFKDKEHPIYGLNEYLMTTRIPGQTQTYAEYFTHTENTRDLLLTIPSQTISKDAIPPSHVYAALFVYIKGRDEVKNFNDKVIKAATISGTGATAGGLAGYGFLRSAAKVGSALLWLTGISPAGWIARGVLLSGKIVNVIFIGAPLATGPVVEYLDKGEPFTWFSSVHFIPFTAERLEGLGCQELPVQRT